MLYTRSSCFLLRVLEVSFKLKNLIIMRSKSDMLFVLMDYYKYEIFTCFNGLLGFSQIMKSEIYTSEKVQEYAHYLNKSANKLKNAFDELFLLAFWLNPGNEKEKETVCLKSVLYEVEDMINTEDKYFFEEFNLKFVMDADMHVSIKAQPEILRYLFVLIFREVFYLLSMKPEYIFYVNITRRNDEVKITLSNLTDDKDQQRVNVNPTNNVFKQLVMDIISDHSGAVEVKSDADGRPLLMIRFPGV